MLRTRNWLLISLSCWLSFAAHAQWREAIPEARRIGAGEMLYFGFSVYDAELWSPASSAEVATLKQPLALQLNYKRSISQDTLVEASVKEIRRLSSRPLEQNLLSRWQAEMQQAFVDVRDGEQITGVYLPDQGARFYLGNQLRHVVDDPEFARAFFLIWLDPKTRNPKLRAQLLGQAD